MLDATEEASKVLFLALDYHAKRMAGASALIASSGDVAARAVSTPGGMYVDRQAAEGGARRAERTRAEVVMRGEVVTKYADRALAAGTAFGDAFVTLADAFEAAYVAWSGPSALRGSAKLEDLYRETAIVTELRSSSKPMAETARMLDSLITAAASDADDDEAAARLDMFCRAARTLATEFRGMAPPRLSAIYGSARGIADDERGQAFAILAKLEKLKDARRPPSLQVAGDVLGESRSRALQLFGSMPRYVVPSEFAIRGQPANQRELQASALPWALDASQWLARALPPSTESIGLASLLGWSPKMQTLRSGTVVRQPRGG
jgi:hypothetical protein